MVDDGDKHPLLAGRIPAVGEVFLIRFFNTFFRQMITVRCATLNSKRVGAAFGTPSCYLAEQVLWFIAVHKGVFLTNFYGVTKATMLGTYVC